MSAKKLVVNGVDFMNTGSYLGAYCSYKPVIRDIDSEKTTRNAEGTTRRDRIAIKRTLTLIFRPLTEEELSTILTLVKGPDFPVLYTDTETNTDRTGDFYAGDRDPGEFDGVVYKGMTLNLVEL